MSGYVLLSTLVVAEWLVHDEYLIQLVLMMFDDMVYRLIWHPRELGRMWSARLFDDASGIGCLAVQ